MGAITGLISDADTAGASSLIGGVVGCGVGILSDVYEGTEYGDEIESAESTALGIDLIYIAGAVLL
ncbi:hypothetical protein N136_04685 [Leifsonia aquatica ATCC 14665]|nr:hypothetical protein N136_04685 [Leifsonia aquatica ATCC 14665]